MLWKEYTTSFSHSFQNQSFPYFADPEAWKHSYIRKPIKHVKKSLSWKLLAQEKSQDCDFQKMYNKCILQYRSKKLTWSGFFAVLFLFSNSSHNTLVRGCRQLKVNKLPFFSVQDCTTKVWKCFLAEGLPVRNELTSPTNYMWQNSVLWPPSNQAALQSTTYKNVWDR